MLKVWKTKKLLKLKVGERKSLRAIRKSFADASETQEGLTFGYGEL